MTRTMCVGTTPTKPRPPAEDGPVYNIILHALVAYLHMHSHAYTVACTVYIPYVDCSDALALQIYNHNLITNTNMIFKYIFTLCLIAILQERTCAHFSYPSHSWVRQEPRITSYMESHAEHVPMVKEQRLTTYSEDPDILVEDIECVEDYGAKDKSASIGYWMRGRFIFY